MKKTAALFCCAAASATLAGSEPALTVYNQNFGIVREILPLELKKGLNQISTFEITAQVEPDSLVIRDADGKVQLRVLEQSYRADPVSEGLLLSRFEGKPLAFLARIGDVETVVTGKVLRSGYTPPSRTTEYRSYASGIPAAQPLIEVGGLLQFSLPGRPLFPALADDSILKPAMTWLLECDTDAKVNAEISYLSRGLNWSAAYNLAAMSTGDVFDIVGWVTIENYSGRAFENAIVKFMAGDVAKLKPEKEFTVGYARVASSSPGRAEPQVTEREFDDFHLYDLRRRLTLRDRETKQVEFIRAFDVKGSRYYVYEGAQLDPYRYSYTGSSPLIERDIMLRGNRKVWIMIEMDNSKENALGVPLPKGKLRLYRRDEDGRLEFVGEDAIDHTPRDEKLKVYAGNAFDLLGERRRTDFQVDHSKRVMTESFEIILTNRKADPVEIRVLETLYRWATWEMTAYSDLYRKRDAQSVEFRVPVAPNSERSLTYTVRYTW